MAHKQFWIFTVTGGEPFKIQIKGNPTQSHHGGTSVLRAIMLDEHVPALEVELRSHGGHVQSNSPREDEETKAERSNMLSVLGEDTVFPCIQCPECAWFDPYLPGMCGVGQGHVPESHWDVQAIQERMTVPKYAEDQARCPLLNA